MTDLMDRYYTPPELAVDIISKLHKDLSPRSCIDTACGGGNLLEAAVKTFPRINCIGIDKDKTAIQRLKRKRPDWLLSVGDMLEESSFARTQAMSMRNNTDLLFINPPFSHNRRKKVNTVYAEKSIKASVAMAHILTSLRVFQPKLGSLIILPESVIYSDVDEIARNLLMAQYRVDIVDELKNDTFSGTRANSVVVNLIPTCALSSRKIDRLRKIPKKILGTMRICRGGLPVFEATPCSNGVPLFHTTDIRNRISRKYIDNRVLVKPLNRGLIAGWVILLPRVGIPDFDSITPIHLGRTVQMSDCVIALRFSDKSKAQSMADVVKRCWIDFVALYKGTGARYTTVSRLTDWVEKKSWIVNVVK